MSHPTHSDHAINNRKSPYDKEYTKAKAAGKKPTWNKDEAKFYNERMATPAQRSAARKVSAQEQADYKKATGRK